MSVPMYDDLIYSICLVCKLGSDLEIPRGMLKAEFRLVEASNENDDIYRALVLPHPSNPTNDFIYRVRCNPRHRLGPIIDFKYGSDVSDEILNGDPRKEVIKRASQLVDVIDIVDWYRRKLCLSFLKI